MVVAGAGAVVELLPLLVVLLSPVLSAAGAVDDVLSPVLLVAGAAGDAAGDAAGAAVGVAADVAEEEELVVE